MGHLCVGKVPKFYTKIKLTKELLDLDKDTTPRNLIAGRKKRDQSNKIIECKYEDDVWKFVRVLYNETIADTKEKANSESI